MSASAGCRAPPAGARGPPPAREAIFTLEDVGVPTAACTAVEDVTFDLLKNDITAFIGPSGCGKSTLLRCLNRMNDLIPSASVTAASATTTRTSTRPTSTPCRCASGSGWSSRSPTRFPKSIYENIAFGPRVLG